MLINANEHLQTEVVSDGGGTTTRTLYFSLRRQGTAYTWGVVDHTCEVLTCQTHYGWVQTPIDQRIPIPLKVKALRQEQGAADAPQAPSVELDNALFKPSANPAAPYLIETDPRFAGRRQWMGSDHQLALLGVDPSTLQKRLGDGFIEQRLVREQITQLTGQRFLGDFSDDEAQYMALLEAGATYAQAHQLRPGIALTAEQVAALTSDIVWLETQVVTLPDGSTQSVLLPRVYLMPRPGDLAPDGSLIAGRQVQLNLSGALLNGGTVAGRELVLIDAQGVQSSGRIRSEGVTALTPDKVWFEGLYSQGEGGEVSFAQYKLAVQTYVRFLADPEHKPIEVEFPN
ncbi:S-layer family protein [Hydrogenophaga sp. SNF1]|uniref:S-layer family protein n=1 Tax=Hydrogenophaga sp. SNF1 TaxID=3098762 RepID=UPI002ACBFA80|nr:S-layer family protein [Hydrogenophaga sp. SNF1]WQB82772.1 S-layer family protein [Hydrogenophaga sp. SNF1]